MKKIFMLSISLFFLCIIGCATTEKNMSPTTFEAQDSGSYDKISIVPKDFIIKGPIFVESIVTVDENGAKNGSEVTAYMLMKEAEKLGADDVVNVRIDKIEDIKYMQVERPTYQQQVKKIKTYTYKATGLAIKYK